VDLLELKLVDEIIQEPPGGAHADPDGAKEVMGEAVRRHISELAKIAPQKLIKPRVKKYMEMGRFTER